MKFSVLAASMIAFAAPAAVQAATPVTFKGQCASGGNAQQAACTGLSGTAGNSATIQSVEDATLSMKITAWQADQSTNRVSSAFLGAYGGGFGVTGAGGQGDTAVVNGTSVAGEGGTHQLDNLDGYTDFVLLQFNRAVHLEGLNLNIYSPYNDSDASIWNGSRITPTGAWNSAINLAGATLDPSLWSNTTGGATSGYRTLTYGNSTSPSANSGFSQVWLVSASVLTTDRNDGFKMSSIMVSPQVAAVPEPATWGMLIMGFGAIGATLRRRRTVGTPSLA